MQIVWYPSIKNSHDMNTPYRRIEKEEVSTLSFPPEDVLNDKEEIIQRKNELERAMIVGNLDKIKIKIFFEDKNEKLFVDTTVWTVTTDRIILKQGITIPIHRISKTA